MNTCQIDRKIPKSSMKLPQRLFLSRGRRGPREEQTTFGDTLDKWKEQKATILRRSTYSTYCGIVENHLRPALGELALDALGDTEVAAYMSLVGGDSSQLSCSTAKGIANVLRSVLEYAEGDGCSARPSACVCAKKSPRAEISVLTDFEQERLLAYLGPRPSGTNLGILICLKTGLRVGEICALRWEDISFTAGLLTVRSTVQRIRADEKSGLKTQLYFGDPKSASSKRSIPLSSSLLSVLEQRRCDGQSFLLSGSPDKAVEPRSMQRHFKNVLRRAGIRDMNFHVLRHTFATKCVDMGFDVKSLSMLLGHSSVSTTMNTYVHPSLERIRSMMSMLD